jgi:branched-chain amino acid transport system substrate-binding protein
VRKVKVFSIFVLLVVTLFSNSVTHAQDKKTIKIGFIADMGGIGYTFFQSQLAGVQIAVNELNAKGGILGKPIEIVGPRDSQLNAAVGATLARQLILEDKVDFLLGPTSSGAALAISQVAKENKVVVAFHTSNSVALTTSQGHPYMVQLVPNTTIEARAVAKFAATLPYTKWGAIGPDYAFGRDSFNAFKPELLKDNSKAQIANEQWPKLGERDLKPFITALQGAKPEAIYSNLWGGDLATFIQ